MTLIDFRTLFSCALIKFEPTQIFLESQQEFSLVWQTERCQFSRTLSPFNLAVMIADDSWKPWLSNSLDPVLNNDIYNINGKGWFTLTTELESEYGGIRKRKSQYKIRSVKSWPSCQRVSPFLRLECACEWLGHRTQICTQVYISKPVCDYLRLRFARALNYSNGVGVGFRSGKIQTEPNRLILMLPIVICSTCTNYCASDSDIDSDFDFDSDYDSIQLRFHWTDVRFNLNNNNILGKPTSP